MKKRTFPKAGPLGVDSLGRFLERFGCSLWLGFLVGFGLLLGGELLLHLKGDGISVHFIDLGCGAEHLPAIRLCSGQKQYGRFNDQLAEVALFGLSRESSQ